MTSYPFLLKLLHERATASPRFSFKISKNEYRITFSDGRSKLSYLVYNQPVRMFSVEHYDWRFFVKFTNMQGQNDYVQIEEFNGWLLDKIKEAQLVK